MGAKNVSVSSPTPRRSAAAAARDASGVPRRSSRRLRGRRRAPFVDCDSAMVGTAARRRGRGLPCARSACIFLSVCLRKAFRSTWTEARASVRPSV
eukprot:9267157-Pyramimonas_sp.AAC.1